jgi:SAM-dependent methyltransferase
MPSLRTRTYEKELLDRDDIPFADIARNMQELDVINTRLGGHAITIGGLRALLEGYKRHTPVHVLEIGCGGGDNLRAISGWARQQGVPVQLTGVDINPECIAYAAAREGNRDINFICSDYRALQPERPADIIFSSLFCHHFTDEELVEQLRWEDVLTRAFSRSYLVKNDAPLSVRRGFRRAEWARLFAAAGITAYQCRWRWAFRWLITVHNT